MKPYSSPARGLTSLLSWHIFITTVLALSSLIIGMTAFHNQNYMTKFRNMT